MISYLAAVYHDIGRTNDGTDLAHGYSSFKKAEKLSLIYYEKSEDYSTVKCLIETHCINDNEAFTRIRDYGLQQPDRAKKLLLFFKDADSLDSVRIDD